MAVTLNFVTGLNAATASSGPKAGNAFADVKDVKDVADVKDAPDTTGAPFDAVLDLSLKRVIGQPAPVLSSGLPPMTPAAFAKDDTGTAEDKANAAVQDLLAQLPSPLVMPSATDTRISATAASPGALAPVPDELAVRQTDARQSTSSGVVHAMEAIEDISNNGKLTAAPAADSRDASAAAIPAADGFALPVSAAITGATTAATTAAAISANAALPVQRAVHTPLGGTGWNHEFSQQISWLAKAELQSASLTLNPPELGPVKVALQLSGSEATALFSSPVPEVRQAIEMALPELKSMMEASGLSLTEASVNQGGPGQHQHDGSGVSSGIFSGTAEARGAQDDALDAADTGLENAELKSAASNQLIDLYA